MLLVGFNVQPKPEAQIERVTISNLATRVAVLEEINIDLDARIGELERIVDQMLAFEVEENVAGESTPMPERRRAIGTPVPTVEATEEATADSELLLDEVIEIEWGPLTDYFEISDVRFETQKITNHITGQMVDLDVLAFNVEAKTTLYYAVFTAEFFDKDGVQVDNLAMVVFQPVVAFWEPGTRNRAYIQLPTDPTIMAKIATIRIE
jgi:hypothetical protein